ncbi:MULTISPECIES: hypothetical protein [Niastella]|uniref:Lipoprotein n=1 Tax=Niastella soli TaxID=2821487 RepID=A0ABS3Z5G9_9BACT|nr:hypothetical protein [Niastella soli]MBO9205415.1 hypothetical protein [Niastella soli]
MHLKYKSCFWMLLGLLAIQCNTNTPTKTKTSFNSKDTTTIQVSQEIEVPKSDTIKFLNVQDLKVSELITRKLVDTSVTSELGERCYLENTIGLNDSIYYTVFSVVDKEGVCSYEFVASLSTKRTNAIATRLLHPDCDVDYSWDEYDLYEHAIVAKNKIEIIKRTVFQKKNRTEQEDTNHEEIKKSYLTISPTGKIRNTQ